MTLSPRIFHVDEDDDIHRIPWARFWRLYNRQEAVQLFAVKTIRFIEVITEADEHGLERILRACYQKVNFDKDGMWDARQKRDELSEAMHQALGDRARAIGQNSTDLKTKSRFIGNRHRILLSGYQKWSG
jgi:hypothetical protein